MSENPYAAALREIEILRELDDDAHAEIAAQCEWLRVSHGGQIIFHLDRTDDVYFLVQGTVRAISYSAEGKEVAFRDIGPGEIFGEYAAIDGEERSANVYAVTEVFTGSLSGAAFRDLLAKYPQVSLAVMRLLTRPTENRAVISSVPTHAEIASRISTHREAVTREINELARSGILTREEGNLVIKDLHMLQDLVEAADA
jgi:CRP/FNR family cyclic AMP-dependent transcriptional regulator